MSLATSTLESELLTLFYDMADDYTGDNLPFAERVTAAFEAFVESAAVTTADTGAITAGAFTGTGSGTIAAEPDECEAIIYAACVAMVNMTSGGNEYLAERMAAGVAAMVDAAVVTCDVTGEVVTAAGVATATTGTSLGSVSCTYDLQSDLQATFEAMVDMSSGGAEYLAERMAEAMESYMLSAVVTTAGEEGLEGSIGTGEVS